MIGRKSESAIKNLRQWCAVLVAALGREQRQCSKGGGECSRRMRSIRKVGSVKQRGRRTHARHALAVLWLREQGPRISGQCQYARTRKLLCFRVLCLLSMLPVTEFVPGAHHRHYSMRSCAQAHSARP